jgi:hypothetical protein
MADEGLDGRARDEDGRIRAKSGAAKMGHLAKTYPELDVFTPDATLTGIKTKYGLDSLEEVRQLARQKRAQQNR